MQLVYHILNGDALRGQFPGEVPGEVIVVRACLVDGPVLSGSLEELFTKRAAFIADIYGECSVEEYYAGSVTEFEKIRNLPQHSEVNLWFEDDLFCQVNFWFTGYLLHNFTKGCKISLVRPQEHTPYGFGGLSQLALREIFAKKTRITAVDKIARLWEYYSSGDLENLMAIAVELEQEFPFILRAVKAHIARIPTAGSKGKPTEALVEIMEALDTREFAPVFQEFSKREAIYGFGDLQVKRIFAELMPTKQ